LVEGEGCFSVAIQREIDNRPRKTNRKSIWKNPSLGFTLKPSFRITIKERDGLVLRKIREKLGVGETYVHNKRVSNKNWEPTTQYYVQTFKDLLKIREFFQRQTFYTTKGEDFKKWAKILEIMESGRHRRKEGFLEILGLREQMNLQKGKTRMKRIEEIKQMLSLNEAENLKKVRLIHNQKLVGVKVVALQIQESEQQNLLPVLVKAREKLEKPRDLPDTL